MSILTKAGLNRISQTVLTLAFALLLSLLGFAASFAETPRSEFMPAAAQASGMPAPPLPL